MTTKPSLLNRVLAPLIRGVSFFVQWSASDFTSDQECLKSPRSKIIVIFFEFTSAKLPSD